MGETIGRYAYKYSLTKMVYLYIYCCFSVFSRLKHPNIVQLLDVYEDKTYVYLVMEL